ncbi:hypothetical protein [Glycomyces algeriensis]|uniref:Uncharacterized protein n=1 Tax=Glycomyces algeriensis TaxID=256037 RepID=A0A9W6GBW8_9ACTN|nr:hypothetical protein [Glycomyces algeriensis]MDA1365646.1 hypothetical protein [Glycomyces algeriensis]MDR7351334.1 hypothetical protein [Glycomyces algeriensis]GLI44050.1 hypothetical protein GALLR39Z86_39000 [Glycomyces algeriensis]
MASLESDGIAVEGTPPTEARPAGRLNWLRAVVALQLAMLLTGTWWVFDAVYDLEGYGGDHWFTAEQFAFNQSVIWIVVPQVAVLAVAVVQVGRSRWGLTLLGLNAAAAVFQAVMLGAFFTLATPLLVVAASQWVLLAHKETRERVRNGSDPRRPLLPEAVVLPAAAAVAVALLVWNHQVNGVDQWHPPRPFDADEAPAVLEGVAVMPVDVLENVEGFPAPTGQELIESPCDEAPGWTEFTLAYTYEEPNAAADPLTQDAVDAMRERLNAEGWDVVWDQEFEASEPPPAGYVIRGEREDGVAIEFQVSDHTTALWIKSDCVRDSA